MEETQSTKGGNGDGIPLLFQGKQRPKIKNHQDNKTRLRSGKETGRVCSGTTYLWSFMIKKGRFVLYQYLLPRFHHQYLLPKLYHQYFLPRLYHQYFLPRLYRQHFLPRLYHQHLVTKIVSPIFAPKIVSPTFSPKIVSPTFAPKIVSPTFVTKIVSPTFVTKIVSPIFGEPGKGRVMLKMSTSLRKSQNFGQEGLENFFDSILQMVPFFLNDPPEKKRRKEDFLS